MIKVHFLLLNIVNERSFNSMNVKLRYIYSDVTKTFVKVNNKIGPKMPVKCSQILTLALFVAKTANGASVCYEINSSISDMYIVSRIYKDIVLLCTVS